MVSHWNACRRQITKASGARLEFSLALVGVAVEGVREGGDGARVVGGSGEGGGGEVCDSCQCSHMSNMPMHDVRMLKVLVWTQ